MHAWAAPRVHGACTGDGGGLLAACRAARLAVGPGAGWGMQRRQSDTVTARGGWLRTKCQRGAVTETNPSLLIRWSFGGARAGAGQTPHLLHRGRLCGCRGAMCGMGV